jgi:F-type H+-transporting ATPase subunit epsilon
MFLEIVTPEATLCQSEVDSVLVPGVEGEFQMLNNHAPIVATLTKGTIKIYGNITIDKHYANRFTDGKDNGKWLPITSGTIEMNANKVIILVD